MKDFFTNPVDIIFYIIIILSLLIGYFSGFGKIVINFFKYIIAIILTYMTSKFISNIIVNKYDYPELLTDIVTKTILFFSLIIILTILTYNIPKKIENKLGENLNAILGVAFLTLRNYFLIVIIFSIINSLYIFGILFSLSNNNDSNNDSDNQNHWLISAKNYYHIEKSIILIEPIKNIIFNYIKYSIKPPGNFEDKIGKLIEEKINNKIENDNLDLKDIDLKDIDLKDLDLKDLDLKEIENYLNNIEK